VIVILYILPISAVVNDVISFTAFIDIAAFVNICAVSIWSDRYNLPKPLNDL
jgi:hypothetical protein